MKLKNKTILGNTPTYYYYTNIDIINDEIYNLVKDLFSIICEQEKEFLIGDNKIIMNFNLPEQISIIIGNYIDLYFVPEILFDLEEKKYIDYYFKLFISKGYSETMKNINKNDKLINTLYNERSEKIGYAFDLKSLDSSEITIESQTNSSSLKNNSSFNNNLFEIILILLNTKEKHQIL